MNWAKLDEILHECERNIGAPRNVISRLDAFVPRDYAEFLMQSNGLEGFVTNDQYLMLWRAEDVVGLNKAYSTNEFLPDVTLVGTDGGDTGFGYDQANKRYISVPLVGMTTDEVQIMGETFEEFVQKLVSS